jgi:hypothetical protein
MPPQSLASLNRFPAEFQLANRDRFECRQRTVRVCSRTLRSESQSCYAFGAARWSDGDGSTLEGGPAALSTIPTDSEEAEAKLAEYIAAIVARRVPFHPGTTFQRTVRLRDRQASFIESKSRCVSRSLSTKTEATDMWFPQHLPSYRYGFGGTKGTRIIAICIKHARRV